MELSTPLFKTRRHFYEVKSAILNCLVLHVESVSAAGSVQRWIRIWEGGLSQRLGDESRLAESIDTSLGLCPPEADDLLLIALQ